MPISGGTLFNSHYVVCRTLLFEEYLVGWILPLNEAIQSVWCDAYIIELRYLNRALRLRRIAERNFPKPNKFKIAETRIFNRAKAVGG